jgi:hypothetical protein
VLGGLGPAEAADNLKKLFWGYEQSITVPGSWSDGSNIKNCVVDYVLWYGDHKELKANLVVLRAEKPIESCAEYLPTLAAIGGWLACLDIVRLLTSYSDDPTESRGRFGKGDIRYIHGWLQVDLYASQQ